MLQTPVTAVALRLVPAVRQEPALVYLGTLDPGTSRGTMRGALENAARRLSSGAAGFDELPWHELRNAHTARLQALLKEDECSAAYTNKIMAAVKGVLHWCKKMGLMSVEEYHAAVDIKSVRGSRLPAGRSVGSIELDALFKTTSDGTHGGARDVALLAVIVGAGVRRAEVAAIRLEDVILATGEITIQGKGNKQRTCFGGPDVVLAIRQWLAVRGEEPGPLFCPVNRGGHVTIRPLTTQAVYDVTQRRAEAAGIASFTPHDLRRTFCSELLEAGVDIVKVQRLMGHASVTTTARYDRRGDGELRKAADMIKLPVRLV